MFLYLFCCPGFNSCLIIVSSASKVHEAVVHPSECSSVEDGKQVYEPVLLNNISSYMPVQYVMFYISLS